MSIQGSSNPRLCTLWLALGVLLIVPSSARAQASLIGDEVRLQISSIDTVFTVAETGALPDYSYSSFSWNVESSSIIFWIAHNPNGTLAPNVSFTLSDLDFSTGVELVGATIVAADGLFTGATGDILTVGIDSIVVDLSSFAGGSLEGFAGIEIELIVESCPSQPVASCVKAKDASLKIGEGIVGNEKLKLELKKLLTATKRSSFGNPVSRDTTYTLCLYGDGGTLVDELSLSRAGEICGEKSKPCWKKTASGYKFKDPEAASDGIRNFLMKSGPKKKGQLILTAGNEASKQQSALPLGLTAALAGASEATVQVRTSHGRCFGAVLKDVKRADPDSFKAK